MASLEKPRQIDETVGKNEEIAGRKLLKNCRKTQEKVWKKGMKWEERQSFEKTRNIEASILKKLRSEAQRKAASVVVRSKSVCKGMTSDAEEGVAKVAKMEENGGKCWKHH